MLLIPACFFSFIALLHHADSSSLIHGSSLVQSSSASSYYFGVLSLQLHAFTSSPHHTFTPSSLQHLWRQSRSDQPSLAPVFLVFFFLSHHGICIPVSLSFFIHIRFFSVSHFGDRLVPLFFLFIFIFSQVSSLAGIISTASSASVHCRSSHLVSSHLISSLSHIIFSRLRLSCSVASVSNPAQHTVSSATKANCGKVIHFKSETWKSYLATFSKRRRISVRWNTSQFR